ncbi:MAG: hypothetical protein KGS61_20365 [Verrucomicrobia bacterium]|nr:hypothetical protein [Verrucomicrobiota bacterium]
MNFRWATFNLYLLLVLLGLGGCASKPDKAKDTTKKHKHEATTLLLHMEIDAEGSGQTWTVPIVRDSPVMVTIDKTPFIDGAAVDEAWVIDQPGGGFAIKIHFNQRGTWLLENMTASYPHHRIAIFSQFGDARWLAAPMIDRRISNGILVFTPDATREEAERIVRGLNNVAKELKKQDTP